MQTLQHTVGQTPLIQLQTLPCDNGSQVLVKLEGNNPGGSVKDRAVLSMMEGVERRKQIVTGDHLIEATSGNTGIALAMLAASRGYRLTLLMTENMSLERQAAVQAYGAKLILVDAKLGMEGARDKAREMVANGEGKMLDQFNNLDNALAHYHGTGPEIWQQTQGKLTHFVASMGTTGTISGAGKFFKQRDPAIQVIGLQPTQGSQIAGIRRWTADYLPGIYQPQWIDTLVEVTQHQAESMARQLAQKEGILAGISSGAAVYIALNIAAAHPGAVVVAILCDRGDRYLSTGIFNQ